MAGFHWIPELAGRITQAKGATENSDPPDPANTHNTIAEGSKPASDPEHTYVKEQDRNLDRNDGATPHSSESHRSLRVQLQLDRQSAGGEEIPERMSLDFGAPGL